MANPISLRISLFAIWVSSRHRPKQNDVSRHCGIQQPPIYTFSAGGEKDELLINLFYQFGLYGFDAREKGVIGEVLT